MPPSLDWSMHWVLGLVTGIGMGWSFIRRYGASKAGVALAKAAGIGLLLGQLVEPALEALIFRESFEAVNPPIRWRLFVSFTVAWMGGVVAVAAASRLRRRTRGA